MRSTRFALVAGLAIAVLALSGCGGSSNESAGDTGTTETTTPSGSTALEGSVGPGFDISLTTEDGRPVESLTPGSYTLVVDDMSDIHDFHLTGPGVDVTTDVAGTGTESFEITLEAGTYSFVCDPHAGSMNGSFEVSG